MAHIGVYVVGICEPMNPGGHGAWGMSFTREGDEQKHVGGYLGRKKEMTEIYALVFGCVQAARFVKHGWQDGDVATISTTSDYIAKLLKGEEVSEYPDTALLVKRFRSALHGLQHTIGVVRKDWVKDADKAARMAVFEAIGKYPARGHMQDGVWDTDTPAPNTVTVHERKTTLDDFGGSP